MRPAEANPSAPSAASAASALPSKKRKASHDAAAASERPRAGSEGVSSQDSDDITAMAYRAILDGVSVTSKTVSMPPKKRKASFETPTNAAAALPKNGVRKASFEFMNVAALDYGGRKASFELLNMAASEDDVRKTPFEFLHEPAARETSFELLNDQVPDNAGRKSSFELFTDPGLRKNSFDTAHTNAFDGPLRDGLSITSKTPSVPPKKRKTSFETPTHTAAAPSENSVRKASIELLNVATSDCGVRKASFELLNVAAPDDGVRRTSFEFMHEAAARETSFELLNDPVPGNAVRKSSFELFTDSGLRKNSFDASPTNASVGPLRKRKLSLDERPRFASIGSIDDAALGLIPLGSASGSHASDEHNTFNIAMAPVSALSSTLAALDHLDALGDESASIHGGSKPKLNVASRDDDASQASSSSNTMASGNQRLLLEALMMGNNSTTRRRDRFESWGGMSDISLTMGSGLSVIDPHPLMDGAAAAAALAASAMHSVLPEDGGISNTSSVSDSDKPVPSKISLTRDRKYSIASLGEASFTGSTEMNPDLQAFVAAAMATVGDQLAELAGVVETVAGSSASISSELMREIIKDDSLSVTSNASSLPDIQQQLQMQLLEGRSRSLSTSSNPIAVDYDAVAAAVDAAEAATGALDLASFASGKEESSSSLLPPIPPIPSFPSSSKSERDMDAIRARARAAAGYIPPANLKPGEIPPPQPMKKRPKQATPHKSSVSTYKNKHHVFVPDHSYSMYNAANKASSQKWDEMYECLVEFVEERRKVETNNMTDKERKEWDWDGNVPTTYKTEDGKALGRWINNQRSAKHKGSLKKDREVKLMSTGLKWSVLSTNSWQDMMEELKLYVSEKTKEGQEWDGNVPTNYKIKGSTDEDGEEKNLGRWINRQRSLYQSGKLRKDREAELESIGLKWSVLSTTSWQSMYETLLDYVNGRKTVDGNWDGNVPANYKTSDLPPKALGRWINRQRTAHQKDKLKLEFVEKLNSIGLKWSVHERRPHLPFSQQETPIKHNLTAVRPLAVLSGGVAGPIATPAKPTVNGIYSSAATPVIKNGRSSAALVAAAAAAAAKKAAATTELAAKPGVEAEEGKTNGTPVTTPTPDTTGSAELRPEAVTSS